MRPGRDLGPESQALASANDPLLLESMKSFNYEAALADGLIPSSLKHTAPGRLDASPIMHGSEAGSDQAVNAGSRTRSDRKLGSRWKIRQRDTSFNAVQQSLGDEHGDLASSPRSAHCLQEGLRHSDSEDDGENDTEDLDSPF